MKYPFIFLLSLTCFIGAAQKQTKQLGFTLGMSAFKSTSANIFYEKQVRSKNFMGVFAERFSYIAKEALPTSASIFTLSEVEVHYYGGLYYKPLITSSRNFSHYFLFGAAAGTFKKELLYYPFTGLEQTFYVSPVSQIFIREEFDYLFKSERHWQPFLKVGMKFKLN